MDKEGTPMDRVYSERYFERKAKKLLGYLKKNIRHNHHVIPRPFLIEFTGSPSSGKTTCITELDKFLRRQGFQVLRPQEGAEVIRHIPRTTPEYNIRTALYALQMIMDYSHGHAYDIVIFDRGLFDAYVWMEYWHEKNKLASEEKNLIQSFFLSRFWIERLDIAYIVTCDAEVAIEREMKIALSSKTGETSNPETMRALAKRYQSAFQELKTQYKQLKLIDTTYMPENKMVQLVAAETLKLLEKKIRR